MQFDLLEKVDLKSYDIDGDRYYKLPNGIMVPSVTTRLYEGETFEDSPRMYQSRERGTTIHEMMENYIMKGIVPKNPSMRYEKTNKGEMALPSSHYMPTNLLSFNALKNKVDKHIDVIRGMEFPLYSNVLFTAGRTDLIAEWDKKLSIVDFKTSRYKKKLENIEKYLLQSAAYAFMVQEMYKIPVKQIVILIAVDHEEPQTFISNIGKLYPRLKEIFVDRISLAA